MKRMNDCASKKIKLEINSFITQATAVNLKVDTYEQPINQAHIEYVLLPRQLAQIAIAYVLNHEKLLDDDLSPRYLFNVPNLTKIGDTEPVACKSISKQDLRRKFVAILIADVAGYCRLMNEDEAGTVSTLTAYKRIMVGLVKR